MVRELNPSDWRGIEGAFNQWPVKWENYPWEIDDPLRSPIVGIHRPDRWGHYRKGHKIGRYNYVWSRIDKSYDLEAIARLEAAWGPNDYPEARPLNFIQRINYAVIIHNHEALMRAVAEMAEAAAKEAVEEYKQSQETPLQRRRRENKARAERAQDTRLSMADMKIEFWEK